ncbi:MAG: Uma2 family endonuclease, partial [Actinomycetota bacterium]|nr:Uma2 family endonuclease [Actinomycetota bacterium]
APRVIHQNAVIQLVLVLASVAPPGVRVLAAPVDVRFSMKRQLQPDVLVVVDGPLDVPRIDTTPLLVVEVLSKSTRSRDLVAKRNAYQDAGIASYWIVDTAVPSLTVLELVDGVYVETVFTGEEPCNVTSPFAVQLDAAALIR